MRKHLGVLIKDIVSAVLVMGSRLLVSNLPTGDNGVSQD
jgi:hypothetical protein